MLYIIGSNQLQNMCGSKSSMIVLFDLILIVRKTQWIHLYKRVLSYMDMIGQKYLILCFCVTLQLSGKNLISANKVI